MKFGINVDPIKKLSYTKNLAHFIGLPLSYDHSKFLLKIVFCLHIFNKMTITLLVIHVVNFWFRFLKSLLNSLLGDI